MNNTIIAPLITEKSMSQAKLGKFTFKVDKEANKKAIKQVVEKRFGVSVVGVTTIIVKGKTQRVGARRAEVTITSWKKAVVTLKKGEKIDLFELA